MDNQEGFWFGTATHWRVARWPNGACEGRVWRPGWYPPSAVLTHQQIRQFRERLRSEYAATQARIARRRGEWPADLQAQGSAGNRGDDSSVEFERETELYEDAVDRATLTQIRKALDRIDEGTYGYSEQSGEPIPIQRLEAVPYATTLVNEALSDEFPPENAG